MRAIKILLLTLMTTFSIAASAASSCSECDKLEAAGKQLSTAPKTEPKAKTEQDKNLRLAYATLQTVITAHEGKDLPDHLLRPLLDLTATLLKIDPSGEAMDALYPLYRLHHKAFDRAIESLPDDARTRIKDYLKLKTQEEKQGNG